MGHVPYHGGLTPPGPLYKVDFFQSFSEGSKKETLVKQVRKNHMLSFLSPVLGGGGGGVG